MVFLAGASVIYVLLLPVARDMTQSLRALHRGESRTVSDDSQMPPQAATGIAASPWAGIWIEPPRASDDSSDVEIRRMR